MFIFHRRKKTTRPLCVAVIVAAGSSSRMGEDKIMLPLGDVPVVLRTVRALETSEKISEIILVTREDLVIPIAQICQTGGCTKVSKVIRGGATRLESVFQGIREVTTEAQLIAIHDGARPFIESEVIDAAIAQAEISGAAAPALPLKDTVKRVCNGLVEETVDRSQLYAVQTPQVFDADLIRGALQKAINDSIEITDDCSAVERLGMKVVLTKGSEENIKLTTPGDLMLARGILLGRGEVL